MSGKETTNIQWSREEIIQLIDLYRQNPCPWNVKSDMYKDRAKRVAALTAIAVELRKTCAAITTGDIKRKIETLRNQHRREMRLVENSRKSGAGIDDIYIPRLWCFNDLSFLNDGDTIRPSLSNIDNATNDTAEEERSDHEIFNDPVLMGVGETSHAATTPVMTPPSVSTACPTDNSARSDTSTTVNTANRSGKRMRDDEDDVMGEALQQLKELSSTQDTTDDCTAFATVVANDLRQLKGETNIYGEKLIYDVLFLAKLCRLSSTSMVKSSFSHLYYCLLLI
ncbi:uncharacterized protein LOC135194952 [Macrobrachium nipponense]|uniref:uncharacterized protein LOC135194952 n=1 Tax=Macrobrachium nipponense TaxID=159736 RepID=UPI0030C7B304